MRHKKILLSLFAVLSFVSNAVFAQVVATDALLGSVLQSFAPAGRQPSAWALDERNNIVYVAAPKQVTAIDAITGMVKKVYPGLCDDSNNMRIVDLEVKQTSLMVVCRDYGLTFLLVNLITEKVDETVSGSNVAISPNDNIYARTNNNNRVEMFSESSRISVSSYKDVGGYEDKSAEQKMVFSPDSSILAVVGSRGTLSLIDVSIGNDIATIGTDTETLRTVRFTADGQSLIVLSDQRLRVLRLGSLAMQFEQPLSDLKDAIVLAFQVGADNNPLLVSTRATIWGGKTRTLLF